MSKDIRDILKDWNYEPGSVSARWIEGTDGRPKIQLRLDLGLFQMEPTGRPDGTRPRGHESLLAYYHQQVKDRLSGETLKLDAEACSALQQEAMQYYYRYLAGYALQNLDGVIRDTQHNLDLIQFAGVHAAREDLAWQFQQFLPYVRMMNARARAERALEQDQHAESIRILKEALDEIRNFWAEHGVDRSPSGNQEIDLLKNLLHEVQSRKPKSPAEQLREELDRAVAEEEYEKAAQLRDRLNALQAEVRDSETASG